MSFFTLKCKDGGESFIGCGYISHETCDKLINYFETTDDKGPGFLGDGTNNSEHKKSTDTSVWIGNISYYQSEIDPIILNYAHHYNMMDIGCTQFGHKDNVNIQKYEPGEGFYSWHAERTNSDYCHRMLVYMTYLNDVPDGGTEFLHQGIITEAKKGLTLVWPSDFTHIHRGVVSNTHVKYITTSWLSFL
jgi:hypothetical protein